LVFLCDAFICHDMCSLFSTILFSALFYFTVLSSIQWLIYYWIKARNFFLLICVDLAIHLFFFIDDWQPQEIGITSHQYIKELAESINIKVSQEMFDSIVREVVEEIGVPASSLVSLIIPTLRWLRGHNIHGFYLYKWLN